MTAQLHAVTGYIQVHGLRPARKLSGAALLILQASAYTQTGPGHGRRIGALCTTALLVTLRANRGTPNADKSGGARRSRSGLAMTCLTLKPTRNLRTTWDPSS